MRFLMKQVQTTNSLECSDVYSHKFLDMVVDLTAIDKIKLMETEINTKMTFTNGKVETRTQTRSETGDILWWFYQHDTH